MTVATVQEVEIVWIADSGGKRRPEKNYAMQQAPGGGQVIAVDLQGQVLSQLAKSALGVYEENFYAPAASAVDKNTGDLWVADGYGQSLIHKYDRSGL